MIHEKDLEYRDNSIVVVEKKQLTWRQIANYKNKLSGRINSLYNDLQEHEDEINRLKQKISSLEEELKRLNSDEVKTIVEKQKEDEKIAHQRALDLLREHIGLEAFTELMEKHRIYWTTSNGTKYKMTDAGRVFRKEGKKWYQLCIVRPKSLPLPDTILAILTQVKQNPTKYPSIRGRR